MNENDNGGWRKSGRSMANGNCVEVRTDWRKAAASMSNGACVEVAQIPADPGVSWARA